MNESLVLIYPSSVWGEARNNNNYSIGIPLSLLYLSGAARTACSDIHIFDYNIQDDGDAALNTLLDAVKPFVVGINCIFSGYFPEVRRIASKIKTQYREIKIVIGGLHPTLYAKDIMVNCEYIDAICLGESDKSFPELLEYYKRSNKAAATIVQPPHPQIDGLALRVADIVLFSEKKHYVAALDELPKPGYEYFDFSQYHINTNGMFNPKKLKISNIFMPLLTSRSCPNQCYFCGMRLVMGNNFRKRSAKHVFSEINYLYDTYNINSFNILDDSFTFDKQRTLEICNFIIKNKLDIYLQFTNGLMIRTLDDEIIDALCECGGIRFNLAIESGNDFIRNKILRKNCSREKIFSTINSLRKYDVIVNAFFMIGFPEDTEQTLQDTLDMIDELDINSAMVSKVNPLPGTALFAKCIKDNLLKNFTAIDNMWKGDNTLATSLLAGGGAGDFAIKPYNLSMEKLEKYSNEIYTAVKKKLAKTALQKLRNK